MSRRTDRDADKLIAMKLQRLILGLLFLAGLFTVSAIAQTNGVTLPGATHEPPAVELGKLLIAVIVPLIVAGAKGLLPHIPSAIVPPLAIALGALADYVGSLLGVWEGNWVVGLALGAAGIGIREVADQWKQKLIPPPPQ